MADPDFKPRKKGESKRSAAYAVCTEALKKERKALGEGRGVGGPKQGIGGAAYCVCPKCGKEIRHKRGTPCTELRCPKCGASMVGKERKSFPMRITKATMRDGGMYWQGVVTDDDWDEQDERLSLSIFRDFKHRLDAQRQKADYQPPFISLSHYDRMDDGSGEIGIVEDAWTHGRVFKSEGWFNDTRLGRRCFEVVEDELEQIKAGEKISDPVRFSIAFYPRQIAEQDNRRVYLKGIFDHVALTRVPVNPRTGFTEVMELKSMTTHKEDALSIVGEDYADDVDDLEHKRRTQKAGVDDLVIKADEDEALAIEEHREQEIILRALLEDEGYDDEAIEKAQWDYAYKKALPDSAYAWVEKGAGCEKKDGKTPQKCRHLPYKDKSGKVDCVHVRAALQAVGGARTGKKMSPPGGAVQKLRRALKGCQKSKAEILEIELSEYQQGRIDGYNAALELDIPDDEVKETMTDDNKEVKGDLDIDTIIDELKPAEEKAKAKPHPVDYHADLLKQLLAAEGEGRSRKMEAGEAIMRSLAVFVRTEIDESTPPSPEDIARSMKAEMQAEIVKPLMDEIAVLKTALEGKQPGSLQGKALRDLGTAPKKDEPVEPFYIDPVSSIRKAHGQTGKSQVRKLAEQGLFPEDETVL